ncbi:MAG TPA: hypothetical protein VLW51_02065 [Solirubrobacteraceae bacterium]|jgi:putative Mn2+ efflux pump MntP|nr:hypothetical protein [Solirubrobacteraceae bacterium]
MLLGAALSIDNLIVGFALGAYRTPLVVSGVALTTVGLAIFTNLL